MPTIALSRSGSKREKPDDLLVEAAHDLPGVVVHQAASRIRMQVLSHTFLARADLRGQLPGTGHARTLVGGDARKVPQVDVLARATSYKEAA